MDALLIPRTILDGINFHFDQITTAAFTVVRDTMNTNGLAVFIFCVLVVIVTWFLGRFFQSAEQWRGKATGVITGLFVLALVIQNWPIITTTLGNTWHTITGG